MSIFKVWRLLTVRMKTIETVALHIAYPGSMRDTRYIWTTEAHGRFPQQLLRSLGGRKLNQNYRARVRTRQESSVHFLPFATKV